jgi:EPS-associated MarR family transcriptional regulator
MIDIKNQINLLKILEQNPRHSQRDLAYGLDISLGKVNYCLKSLIEKGLIKAENFKNNNNKSQYAYLLTPKGIKEKSKLTKDFLQRKIMEYEMLEREIASLKREIL